MNNIFIGEQCKGFFLDELDIGKVLFTGYIPFTSLKQTALDNDMQCIIIDISLWDNQADANIIANTINEVAATTRAKIIILAPGYSLKSKLITALHNNGISNIVTAGTVGEIKAEFLEFYNTEESSPIERIDNAQVKDVFTSNSISIAVAGAQNRIGTTTQCFQIVKYLISKGHKAAYIEFNQNHYLKAMRRLFGIDGLTFEGLALFAQEEITDALKEFDYLVYDYGSMLDTAFSKYSFIERDIKILCCGASAGEIEYSTKALASLQQYQDINYLFSFVAEADKADIQSQMGNHPTYFSPLIADPFSVLNAECEILGHIIKTPNAAPNATNNKRSFFRHRRKS